MKSHHLWNNLKTSWEIVELSFFFLVFQNKTCIKFVHVSWVYDKLVEQGGLQKISFKALVFLPLGNVHAFFWYSSFFSRSEMKFPQIIKSISWRFTESIQYTISALKSLKSVTGSLNLKNTISSLFMNHQYGSV